MKVMLVFGTRPEAIKMCPLVLELKKRPEIETIVCTTGQHKELLDQVMEIFDVKADYNLSIMAKQQTLSHITTAVLEGMQQVLQQAQPDLVLVHGDTTTSFAAALAAFYQKIPVGHVEAGLRTYNKYSPFPEEMNRNLVGRIASWHFAPTEGNRLALEKEGVTENVFVTGNTVIDCFATTVKENYVFRNSQLNHLPEDKKIITMTAHRRENWGEGIANICTAVNNLCARYPDALFVYPVHLNPVVKDRVTAALAGNPQVMLTAPLDVEDMHNLMDKSYFVLTDSGGLQEEAPHLGKPVVVLRKETERPEAVAAGTAIVAGTDVDNIEKICSRLFDDEEFYNSMAEAINPYGDGTASKQIADIIISNIR
ncbi:MAG: UDP-N-acetylglucosamine 2-epimerase (non-hydrolyzing) [Oscillospiraceae bacterium]|nr:UDP-N-acetylglucosamine 2-epimerase (non-hydrolyzing) [Oscillospiraceae bacterium]